MIEPEKKDAGSPFGLAERRALPAAEWVWRENRRFPKSNQELFAAQFVLGEGRDDTEGMNEGVASGESQVAVADGGVSHGVVQIATIGRKSAFTGRLRGWLLSE